MKKTLVALAAVAATSAFAQSSVSIYGLFDVNYGTQKSTVGAVSHKSTGLGEGVTAGNRIGFRGTEDLGSGMKASFVVETAFSAITTDIFGNRASHTGHSDTNLQAASPAAAAPSFAAANATGTAWTNNGQNQNRQSFVGLSGGFGEVRVGYQYTVAYTVSSLSGYLGGFEGAAGADAAHTWGAGGYGFAGVGGARANGLTYMSPKFAGGFDVVVQYGGTTNPTFNSSGSAATSNDKQTRTGLLVNYANGPLKASLARTAVKTQANGGATTTPTIIQLGGSYNFGVASLVGTYNKGDNDAGTDSKSHQIGVSVPFGKTTFMASFGKAETTAAGVKTVDGKQSQFGATYALSKRTSLYGVSGTTKESFTAAKATTTRFGVRHTF